MRNDQNLDLRLERLEERQMLAGDVSVVASNGDLSINGDSQGNELLVISEGFGDYEVRGINGTTINGQQEVFLSNVTDDLIINLRNGDNAIALSGIDDPFEVDDIKISSRRGNDLVSMYDVVMSGKLQISTSGGDDGVFINSTKADSVKLSTGSGSDVTLVTDIAVAGRSTSKFGQGDDVLLTSISEYQDNARFTFGGGDDFGGSSSDVFDGNLLLNYGGGTDELMGDVSFPSTFNGGTNVVGHESVVTASGFLGALDEFDSAVQARNLGDVLIRLQDVYNEI